MHTDTNTNTHTHARTHARTHTTGGLSLFAAVARGVSSRSFSFAGRFGRGRGQRVLLATAAKACAVAAAIAAAGAAVVAAAAARGGGITARASSTLFCESAISGCNGIP
eukprot:3698867-Pleurochrysis_carterae.AAC.1